MSVPGAPELRDYQRDLLRRIRETGARRTVAVMPTGAGKSHTASSWAAEQLRGGRRRGLVLSNRVILLGQFARTLRQWGLSAEVLAGAHEPEGTPDVICASFQTLHSRGRYPEADYIIVDECHGSAADTYGAVLSAYDRAQILGLTATPARSDGQGLDGLYDAIVAGPSIRDLLKFGALVPVRLLRPETRLKRGLAQEPLDAWNEHCQGRPGFIFASSVKMARQLAEEIPRSGCIIGTTPDDERDRLLEQFQAGELDCLTNYGCLVEGVDATRCSSVVIARGMSHVGAYLQAIGRGMRPHEGKSELLVVDLSGCSWTHGHPAADRAYSLDGKPIVERGVSVSSCERCGFTLLMRETHCPECEHPRPVMQRKGPAIQCVTLVEYVNASRDVDLAKVPPAMRRAVWSYHLEQARAEHRSVAWLVERYRQDVSREPDREFFTPEMRAHECRRLARVMRDRGLDPGWVSHKYKETFGAFPSRPEREAAGVPLKPLDSWRR